MVRGEIYFAPQLVTPAVNQSASAGTSFTYQVAPGAFFDADHNGVTLSATLASGAPLPTWLSFDPLTGQFKGTPPVRGTFQVAVRATDAQNLSDSAVFRGRG